MTPGRLTAVLVPAILAAAHQAGACPSCYGAPDSPMTQGANAAILVMVGITGSVLGAIGTFFLMMRKRYAAHRDALARGEFVNTKDSHPWNNS